MDPPSSQQDPAQPGALQEVGTQQVPEGAEDLGVGGRVQAMASVVDPHAVDVEAPGIPSDPRLPLQEGGGEPTPGEATGLDGAALLQEKCTVCHDLERVTAEDNDAVGWAAVIDEMIAKGAQVSEDEAAAIAEYLSLQ